MSDVYRLGRQMAYSGIGTKKRIYHAVPRCKPTAEQWEKFVELPGCDGGLKATTLEVPPWLQRAVQLEPVPSQGNGPGIDPQHEEQHTEADVTFQDVALSTDAVLGTSGAPSAFF